MEWLAPAEEAALALADNALLAEVWLAQASAIYIQGQFTEALPRLERLLPLAEASGNPALLVRTHNILGRLLALRGEYARGIAYLERAIPPLTAMNEGEALVSAGLMAAAHRLSRRVRPRPRDHGGDAGARYRHPRSRRGGLRARLQRHERADAGRVGAGHRLRSGGPAKSAADRQPHLRVQRALRPRPRPRPDGATRRGDRGAGAGDHPRHERRVSASSWGVSTAGSARST